MASLKDKSDAEIDTWIINHERHSRTTSALYLQLIEERNRRHGHGLDLQRSLEAIIAAARIGRFISYGELAEANGIPWASARHRMNGAHGHLQDLLSYCHSKGMPLLTAIIVQKGKLQTGEMDRFTLDGFVEGSQRLGIPVTDPSAFLDRCQKECFSWVRQVGPETSGEVKDS